MKRLREEPASTPLLEQAHAMLDAVPPLAESHERMQRVRRELDRPRGLLAGMRRLPALALAGLVALFGASAFAAVRVLQVMQPRAADAAAASRTRAKQKPRPAQRAEASTAAEPPASAMLADAPDAGLHVTAAALRAASLTRVAKLSQAAASAASDSELVHRAVKALRRDGDPALAARLLEAHRARSPAGPLAEEALSLQIEAALALHDPHARALAREYVSRYPSGRYLPIARRALPDAAP